MQLFTISVVGVVVLLALPVLYMGLRAKFEIAKMSPLDTQELMPGLFVVKDGHANVFLVKDSDGYIAFDAGNKSKITAEALQSLGIDPLEVKAVFLTHSDFDHNGAIMVFKRSYVYMAKDEEQMIDGTTARTFGRMGILRLKNKLKRTYGTVNDGDLIKIGNMSVECILTPGHTPGSMCYVLNGKYLFTGDTLRLINGKVHGFVPFFTMDMETNKKSIHKLTQKKEITHIFTAHFGFSNEPQSAFSGWGGQ